MLHIADKRTRTKARADKQFDRMYGACGSSAATAGANACAPRAAVYSGHMGSRQRRASKIHESSGTPQFDAKSKRLAHNAAPTLTFSTLLGRFPKWLSNTLAAVVCLALTLMFLYTPAAQCYTQMRERDRLSAEYAAVISHNETLQQSVDSLQSETGIEDRATEQFGMVKEGENAVSVSGLSSSQDDSSFTSTITPGSIPAPDTWYSGVLDAIFGYEK